MVTAWAEKPDAELLSAIQQGSHHAFAVLVGRHSLRFYRLAYRYMAQKEAAEDMVQQAFLKLWERPDQWQENGGASFTTWFGRVVVHLCIDAKRRKGALPLDEDFDTADMTAVPQDEQFALAQQQQALEVAIQSLPENQQTALNLCFYEGISNRDAAELMQTTVKAVESLLMRAKATLKERLSARYANATIRRSA